MSTRQKDRHCDAGATEFQNLINPVDTTEHKSIRRETTTLTFSFLSRNFHLDWGPIYCLAILKEASEVANRYKVNHQVCHLWHNIHVNHLKYSIYTVAFISQQDHTKLANSLAFLRIHWVHLTYSLGTLYAFTGYTLRILLGTLYAFTRYIINVCLVHYHWWVTRLLRSQSRVYCDTLRDYWYLGYTHILQNISSTK